MPPQPRPRARQGTSNHVSSCASCREIDHRTLHDLQELLQPAKTQPSQAIEAVTFRRCGGVDILPHAQPFLDPLHLCLLLFATLASAQGQRGGGAAAGRAEAIPSIADRTGGMKKIDGFFPLYWDEAGGRLFVEIPKLDTEVLYSTGFGDRPRLERHRHRPRRAGRLAHRQVRARRAAHADGRSRTTSSAPLRTNAAEARTSTTRSRARCCGASRLPPKRRARARRLHRVPRPRRQRHRRPAARPAAYRFDARRSSDLHAETRGFPKNTEMEAELTFVRQPRGAGGRRRGGGGRGGGGFFEGVGSVAATRGSGQHPRRTTRSSNCRTRTTSRALTTRAPATSACQLRGLRRAARRADDAALHRAPPAARRTTRRRRSASRSSRSSTTSIPARRSRSARRSSRARAGGTRRSRRRATATPSRSSCCPTASARSTSATT